MTNHDAAHFPLPQAVRPLARQSRMKRVNQMASLWGLFGTLVGLATLGGEPNAIGVLSAVLAGVIVLVPFGVVLGLAGGRPEPTLVGGVGGAGLGAVAGFLAGTDGVVQVASVAGIGGAVAGSTLHLASSWVLSLTRAATVVRRSR
jgi:hypothetical protein